MNLSHPKTNFLYGSPTWSTVWDLLYIMHPSREREVLTLKGAIVTLLSRNFYPLVVYSVWFLSTSSVTFWGCVFTCLGCSASSQLKSFLCLGFPKPKIIFKQLVLDEESGLLKMLIICSFPWGIIHCFKSYWAKELYFYIGMLSPPKLLMSFFWNFILCSKEYVWGRISLLPEKKQAYSGKWVYLYEWNSMGM